MNQSGPPSKDELPPSELRRALEDAQAETGELHRELAALRLRLVLQARELEALRQGREQQAAPPPAPATLGRRVKDRLLRSPLRHPLLPVWRLYVESGLRDNVNRVRGAVTNSFRR